jgi:transposase
MPSALPVTIRRAIFQRWQSKTDTVSIAHELGLSRRTVEALVRRFRQRGDEAIEPDYRHEPLPHLNQVRGVEQTALALRREHARWGAPLIRVMLGHRFAARRVPSTRTLQRWFAHAGLSPAPKGRHPSEDRRRAERPHAVWQMDGCEQLAMANRQQVCWLRVVDEYTGAVLLTVVFAVARFAQVPAVRTQQALRKAFTIWGLPGALRVDNGPPWGSKGDLPTDLALWVLGLGVRVICNPPHRPRCNGVVERFQGVGQCWLEPEACVSVRELQERATRMDRLQREEYPIVAGQSRLQLYPDLAHSGTPYNRSWEKGHWDLRRVDEHLAALGLPRQVDRKGLISVYNRNRYVGVEHAGQTVWFTFDPQLRAWIVADGQGRLLRQLDAPEISHANIIGLSVSHKRD